MPSPDREIYRDPTVVRADDRVDEVVHTDTARKMLSIFRQMEENASKEELPDGPKPLKRFTPPPEDKFAKATASDSEEDEDEEGEDSDGDDSVEERDPNYVRSSDKVRVRAFARGSFRERASSCEIETPPTRFCIVDIFSQRRSGGEVEFFQTEKKKLKATRVYIRLILSTINVPEPYIPRVVDAGQKEKRARDTSILSERDPFFPPRNVQTFHYPRRLLSSFPRPGGGRVPEAGAERGARQDPARQVRALGGDRRQSQQSSYRRDGDGPGHGRAVQYRVREQSASALRVPRLAGKRISARAEGEGQSICGKYATHLSSHTIAHMLLPISYLPPPPPTWRRV